MNGSIDKAVAVGKTVVVGMSGGIDSAVTAALLQEAGCRVIGVTLTLWKDEGEDEKRWQDRSCCKIGLARHVAKQLSIPHHSIDIREAFQAEIIDDFCDAYLTGRTPNPCVRCNERMKFGRLLSAARELGADLLATGHYARIEYQPERNRHALYKGADLSKEQSYFLYRLNQDQLAHTLFPLGEMSKEKVYEKAAALGLPYEEVLESQEICFVTQKDYRVFLSEQRPAAQTPGKIVTESGEVVGEHAGVAFYTVGQRRGLGVALGERMYVTRLDPEKREVVVGSEDSLLQKELTAENIVWGGIGPPAGPLRVRGKIRYRFQEKEGTLVPLPDGRARLLFDEPQRGITPGQSVVFYQGDEVIGGGIIRRPSLSLNLI
ncbi:MAG TPA: tRNA 2-thiouridine(34) synthase MnmA [Candidatus Manganitrophaceae bacterium]|nr:tRNA 2-thiouridine(34) synthase MnmA [Candidatus Manganitrophaceae bacterium]